MHRQRLVALLAVLLSVSSCLWAQATQPAQTPADLGRLTRMGGAAPGKDDSFRFVVMGDNTSSRVDGKWAQAIEQANGLAPDFVINVGDLIDGYSEDPAQLDAMWRDFAAITGKLNAPFFICPGNHDVSNDTMLKDYIARWGRDGRSYYSFDYRGCHFIVLDSTSASRLPEFAEEQFAWLATDLAAAKDAKHVFMFFHYPAWQDDVPFWNRLVAMVDPAKTSVYTGHWHEHFSCKPAGIQSYVMGVTGAEAGGGIDIGQARMIAHVAVTDGKPRMLILPVDQVRAGEYLPEELLQQRMEVARAIRITPRLSEEGLELTVTQGNPYKVPVTVLLTSLPPEGEPSGPVRLVVQPGQEQMTTLKIAGLPTAAVQLRASYAFTDPSGQDVAFDHMMDLPTLARAPRAGITVDGDLADWDKLSASTMVSRPPDTAPEDLTCSVRIAHDSRRLYLAVQIRDESVYCDDPNMGLNDSMDLYLHIPPGSGSGMDNPPVGYVKIGVPPPGQPVRAPSWKLGEGQKAPDMTYACRRTADGYLYEISLDLAGIGCRTPVAAPQEIWWRLGVNDRDIVNGQLQPRVRHTTSWPQTEKYVRAMLE